MILAPALPPLPEVLRVISLWDPYASLVVDGIKTLETRTWPWPYEPGRQAWPLSHGRRFVYPVPFRGPQKFASVPRETVAAAAGVQ